MVIYFSKDETFDTVSIRNVEDWSVMKFDELSTCNNEPVYVGVSYLIKGIKCLFTGIVVHCNVTLSLCRRIEATVVALKKEKKYHIKKILTMKQFPRIPGEVRLRYSDDVNNYSSSVGATTSQTEDSSSEDSASESGNASVPRNHLSDLSFKGFTLPEDNFQLHRPPSPPKQSSTAHFIPNTSRNYETRVLSPIKIHNFSNALQDQYFISEDFLQPQAASPNPNQPDAMETACYGYETASSTAVPSNPLSWNTSISVPEEIQCQRQPSTPSQLSHKSQSNHDENSTFVSPIVHPNVQRRHSPSMLTSDKRNVRGVSRREEGSGRFTWDISEYSRIIEKKVGKPLSSSEGLADMCVMILKNQADLTCYVKDIDKRLISLESRTHVHASTIVDGNLETESVPNDEMRPISSNIEYEEFCNLISTDNSRKTEIIDYLSKLGGSNLHDFVKRQIDTLICKNFQCRFNATGKFNKIAFNQHLQPIVIKACRKNKTFSDTDQKQIEKQISRYLRWACDRGQNRTKRRRINQDKTKKRKCGLQKQ